VPRSCGLKRFSGEKTTNPIFDEATREACSWSGIRGDFWRHGTRQSTLTPVVPHPENCEALLTLWWMEFPVRQAHGFPAPNWCSRSPNRTPKSNYPEIRRTAQRVCMAGRSREAFVSEDTRPTDFLGWEESTHFRLLGLMAEVLGYFHCKLLDNRRREPTAPC